MEEGDGECSVPTHYRFLGFSAPPIPLVFPLAMCETLPVSVSFTLQAHWGGFICVQCRFDCGNPMSLAPSRIIRITLTSLIESLKFSLCRKSSISKVGQKSLEKHGIFPLK